MSLNKAGAKARDAKRLTDLSQIRKAILMYHLDNNYYPKEANGANGKVGEGAGLDAMLTPYISKLPHDPSGPGDATHYYYYDGRQSCDGKIIAVLFARTMEHYSGNPGDICSSWGGEGGAGSANAYHFYIGSTQ